MIYFCCDTRRRDAVRESALNGMDYLEVLDAEAPTPAERQRTLLVHFLKADHLAGLAPANVRIAGVSADPGARAVRVTGVRQRTGDPPQVLAIDVDRPGDFSLYELCLVQDARNPQPPANFDPRLAALEFSFKAECPTDFDCRAERDCPVPQRTAIDIDYLAKDYASFRRLMLDRMRTLMPQWNPRTPADQGIALTEALACVADYLSYRQDAVATEAYFGTARLRTSVRRHARLVDYFVHEGCNARAWVQVQVVADAVPVRRGTQLLSGVSAPPAPLAPDSTELDHALAQRPAVFEVMHDALLFAAHQQMRLYTWSDQRCCLPRNATRATLFDDVENRLRLCAGDVLIFEERTGPATGNALDANPAHRHAVRLTRVHPQARRVFEDGAESSREADAPVTDPVTGQAIVEIEWDVRDRLPFPVCISSVDRSAGDAPIDDVSVVLGNIVLADHGAAVHAEPIGEVPQPKLRQLQPSPGDPCVHAGSRLVPPRFRPRLALKPITQAVPFDADAPASAALAGDARQAMPVLKLESRQGEEVTVWSVRRDLLSSAPDAAEIVAEAETDGAVRVRFGDDQHARRPAPGTAFVAHYRVGNGGAGNVGADSITHIVTADPGVRGVRNPLPARGGSEPESIEAVRQRAPYDFRQQERAVTEADYAEVTERLDGVQSAAGTFRWTGSWHTAFVTVDRVGGLLVDEEFSDGLRAHVEQYRMAGQDVEVDAPSFVPLEIEMQVCVAPDYFRSDVKAELMQLFSSRVLRDGSSGVFHPDNFSFGETVYLSRIYAAAQSVPGVQSAHVTTFRRLGRADPAPLEEGRLAMGRLEIARLDNEPGFPGRGVFRLTLGGGK